MPIHTPDTTAPFTEFLVNNFMSGSSAVPTLLICFPSARMNKYQALLYKHAATNNFKVLRVASLNDLDKIFWPGPVVFHAHWFSSVMSGATNDDEAFVAIDEAFEKILDFKARTNASLVWSAHNLFPHNKVFVGPSLKLRQMIFENFDQVHYLNAKHRVILEKAYDRKSPSYFTVPHMTYDGVFSNYESKAFARDYYQLNDDEFVFGFFGSIQEYKGLDHLIDSLNALSKITTKPVKLLMAGFPSNPDLVNALKAEAITNDNFVLDARKIPDDEVQLVHNASDIIVLPYSSSLNSGAAFAAMTFDKPVIAPDTAAFSFLPEKHTFLYDQADSQALLRIMKDVLKVSSTVPATYSKATLKKYSVDTVSNNFFKKLKTVPTG